MTENGAAMHSTNYEGPPISRRPTVISITSGEHSKRQRSPLSRDQSIHMEGSRRLDSNIQGSLMSLTSTEPIDQHVLHNLFSTSNKDASGPEARRWTRGAFVIGRAAPVKIDKGIEVYLRSGADGEVDFVI
jgi:hypothetical protein